MPLPAGSSGDGRAEGSGLDARVHLRGVVVMKGTDIALALIAGAAGYLIAKKPESLLLVLRVLVPDKKKEVEKE